MILRLLIAGALLCSLPSGAGAMYFDDNGNDYYGRCSKDPPHLVCYATASAFIDMMMALGYKCKRDVGVTRQQAADVLVKYLRDYPAVRSEVLAFSAILAFEDAFGCTQTPPRPR